LRLFDHRGDRHPELAPFAYGSQRSFSRWFHAHNQYRDGYLFLNLSKLGLSSQLKNLGTSGAATSGSADLVDSVLAGGTKSGYTFVYTGDGNTPSTGYSIVATRYHRALPVNAVFFTDQSGVIRNDPAGAATSASAPLALAMDCCAVKWSARICCL